MIRINKLRILNFHQNVKDKEKLCKKSETTIDSPATKLFEEEPQKKIRLFHESL